MLWGHISRSKPQKWRLHWILASRATGAWGQHHVYPDGALHAHKKLWLTLPSLPGPMKSRDLLHGIGAFSRNNPPISLTYLNGRHVVMGPDIYHWSFPPHSMKPRVPSPISSTIFRPHLIAPLSVFSRSRGPPYTHTKPFPSDQSTWC